MGVKGDEKREELREPDGEREREKNHLGDAERERDRETGRGGFAAGLVKTR